MAEKVTLASLARQQVRAQEDLGRMRDDMAVLLAIVQRMAATMAGFVNELRALHGKQDRVERGPT